MTWGAGGSGAQTTGSFSYRQRGRPMIRPAGSAPAGEKVMASKIKALPREGGALARPDLEIAPDTPLLDLPGVAVRAMIKAAKKRGYVTHDQFNSAMLSEKATSERIEDVLAMLNETGIRVVEVEEAEPDEEEQRAEAEEESAIIELRSAPTSVKKMELTERTDDPVRMYLREMGSVELLSREGEIAIAKRIEAGREAMIAGLCESPLTFQAIIIWRGELNEGKVFLRDIIDLEATYAGPDAKAMPAPVIGPDGQPIVAVPGAPPAAPTGVTPFKGAPERANAEEGEGGETPLNEGDFDDDMENSLSLAAIE